MDVVSRHSLALYFPLEHLLEVVFVIIPMLQVEPVLAIQEPVRIQLIPRLVIPVLRNLFFGPKKAFLTGFLRIFLFFLCFPEELFTGTWFWRGLQ